MLEFEYQASLYKLVNPFINSFHSFETERINFFIGNAVISFILILSYIGKMEVVVDFFFSLESDVFFAEIVLIVTDV